VRKKTCNTYHIWTMKMFNRHDPHSSITYLPTHPPNKHITIDNNLFLISENLQKKSTYIPRYIIVGRNISLLMKFCHKVKWKIKKTKKWADFERFSSPKARKNKFVIHIIFELSRYSTNITYIFIHPIDITIGITFF
jgi:hypothetical protein